MRRIAFIIAILGILVLISLIWLMPVVEITGNEDLEGLEENQNVALSGFVDYERDYSGMKIMEVKGIKVICFECDSLKDKVVEIRGIVKLYEDEKEVEVLSVNILH